MKAQRFHELPLVIFTTLAILGAGMLTVPLLGVVAEASDPQVWREPSGSWNVWREASASRSLVALALLSAGLVVSLAHLGKPARSPLALARLGRSRLSLEIALAGATIASGAAAIAWPAVPSLPLLAALFATAFLLALGFVYALPAQLTWRGAAALTPLTMGLGFGVLVLSASGSNGVTTVPPPAVVVLVADAIAFALRSRRVSASLVADGRPSRGAELGAVVPRWSGARWPLVRRASSAHLLLAARLVLVDALPCVLLLAGLPKGAAGVLGLGVHIDRLGFYLLAAQHTTEREIENVEDLIDGM